MNHKCDGCKYKSEHQEMMFSPFGVCTRTTNLIEAVKNYDAEKCPYEINTWVISENGCVITCPECGERLELCYPDGTEVRYLPYCPWCGKKLDKGE